MYLYTIIFLTNSIIGIIAGFFISKHFMIKYIKQNSVISEQMIRTMLLSSGVKPSQKKINQILKTLNSKAS